MVPGSRMLVLMALPVVIAAAIVLLVGRTEFRALLSLRLRVLWLMWAAAAIQFLRVTDPEWAAWLLLPLGGVWTILLTWTFAVAFCVVNLATIPPRARLAMAVLVIGFSMNSLTMAVNHGMPFSPDSARVAGFSEQEIATPVPGKHPQDSDTSLMIISDVVPVPGLQKVLSVGDILMLLGLTWLLVRLLSKDQEEDHRVSQLQPVADRWE